MKISQLFKTNLVLLSQGSQLVLAGEQFLSLLLPLFACITVLLVENTLGGKMTVQILFEYTTIE